MTITKLITGLPNRTMDQTTFDNAVAQVMTDLPLWAGEVNATTAAINSLASGGGVSIPYTFSTTTADADPGNGFLRLDNATQNLATVIRTDLVGADGTTWTTVLDALTASNSTVKGQLRLTKINDASKWILFNVTAIASPTGYRNITAAVVGASSASPFVNGDSLVLGFSRTGDVGTAGTIALRFASITTGPTPTPNAATTDIFAVTALAEAPTFAAPTGSPSDGQGMFFRIKDNGTARVLAWNAIYRAGTDLALPATTVLSKVLYVGFRYNAIDTKWDLVSVLNNI